MAPATSLACRPINCPGNRHRDHCHGRANVGACISSRHSREPRCRISHRCSWVASQMLETNPSLAELWPLRVDGCASPCGDYARAPTATSSQATGFAMAPCSCFPNAKYWRFLLELSDPAHGKLSCIFRYTTVFLNRVLLWSTEGVFRCHAHIPLRIERNRR